MTTTHTKHTTVQYISNPLCCGRHTQFRGGAWPKSGSNEFFVEYGCQSAEGVN